MKELYGDQRISWKESQLSEPLPALVLGPEFSGTVYACEIRRSGGTCVSTFDTSRDYHWWQLLLLFSVDVDIQLVVITAADHWKGKYLLVKCEGQVAVLFLVKALGGEDYNQFIWHRQLCEMYLQDPRLCFCRCIRRTLDIPINWTWTIVDIVSIQPQQCGECNLRMNHNSCLTQSISQFFCSRMSSYCYFDLAIHYKW